MLRLILKYSCPWDYKLIQNWKVKFKMAQCLEYIFCCFSWGNTETQRGDNNVMATVNKKKTKQKPKPKPSRIVSKYRPEQTIEVQKQEKKKGKMVYTCPICTLYYNRILACTNCQNNICRSCAQSYEKKFQLLSKQNMKCPFCSSETSTFVDYEQAARSYFDTTGKNGFLDPAERKKIDQEMKMERSIRLQQGDNNNRSIQLYRIQEDEANENPIQTEVNIGEVDNYVAVEVRRNPNSIEGQQEQEQEGRYGRDQSSVANLRDNHSNLGQYANHQPRPEMSVTV